MTGGHGNNGVAHGIAGPLAVLSIATRYGDPGDGPGRCDRGASRAGWTGTAPSTGSPATSSSADEPPQAPPARPSWCYGDLGITRALQLAAIALGDPARQQAAEDSAMAALTDPARLGRITDASLCHGWAGLLTATRAIAADSPAPGRFTACIEQLNNA